MVGRDQEQVLDWRERYGRVNEQDFWLEDWEKQAIVAFHLKNPLEGYWRLTFMMLDADIVAVSPASVWRGAEPSGAAAQVEPEAVQERGRLRATARTRSASALAYRRELPRGGAW